MVDKQQTALDINRQLHIVLRVYSYPKWHELIRVGRSHDYLDYENDKLIIQKQFANPMPAKRQQSVIRHKLYDISVSLKLPSGDADQTMVFHLHDVNDGKKKFEIKMFREGKWIAYIQRLAKEAIEFQKTQEKQRQKRADEQAKEAKQNAEYDIDPSFAPIDDADFFDD